MLILKSLFSLVLQSQDLPQTRQRQIRPCSVSTRKPFYSILLLFFSGKLIPHSQTWLSSQLLPQDQRIHPNSRNPLSAGWVGGIGARQAIPAQNQGPNSPQQEPGQHRPAGLKCEFKTASTAVMPSCVGVESVCVCSTECTQMRSAPSCCVSGLCVHVHVSLLKGVRVCVRLFT